MTKNINFDANSDDTEGHLRIADEAPGVRAQDGAPSFRISDEAPATKDDDEDDTEGHLRIADGAPGITGSLSVDPKTQS